MIQIGRVKMVSGMVGGVRNRVLRWNNWNDGKRNRTARGSTRMGKRDFRGGFLRGGVGDIDDVRVRKGGRRNWSWRRKGVHGGAKGVEQGWRKRVNRRWNRRIDREGRRIRVRWRRSDTGRSREGQDNRRWCEFQRSEECGERTCPRCVTEENPKRRDTMES